MAMNDLLSQGGRMDESGRLYNNPFEFLMTDPSKWAGMNLMPGTTIPTGQAERTNLMQSYLGTAPQQLLPSTNTGPVTSSAGVTLVQPNGQYWNQERGYFTPPSYAPKIPSYDQAQTASQNQSYVAPTQNTAAQNDALKLQQGFTGNFNTGVGGTSQRMPMQQQPQPYPQQQPRYMGGPMQMGGGMQQQQPQYLGGPMQMGNIMGQMQQQPQMGGIMGQLFGGAYPNLQNGMMTGYPQQYNPFGNMNMLQLLSQLLSSRAGMGYGGY